MKFSSISYFPLSNFPTHQKISDFIPVSRLGGDPIRIINSESYFMKGSLKRNWWKLLRGNENVNSFVDFRVPLNYNFKLCRIQKSWEEFLGSAEEWHHVSSGRQEREESLLHSLSLGVQRIKRRPSIQPIIKFIFSPHSVGLTSRAMRQSETPFCLSNFETKQKPGIFTRGIEKSG